MRVEKLRQNIDWVRTWKNLNEAPVPETTRGVWYRVIHEIITMNECLHLINMVQTDTCRKCASKDTLEHRLLVCGEGKLIWEYSRPLIVRMLRMIPLRIPDDWIIHPQFHIWPPKRRRAILWTLTNVVTVDPGSKPDQKYARRRYRQKYVTRTKYKFGTYSKRISFVCCTLVRCKGVGLKVTGIKFMTMFIA